MNEKELRGSALKLCNPTFDVNIRWNPADNSFVAEVPELPGCMADGATRREALANVERVIREWIETAHAEGRPVPKPTSLAPASVK